MGHGNGNGTFGGKIGKRVPAEMDSRSERSRGSFMVKPTTGGEFDGRPYNSSEGKTVKTEEQG